VKCDLLVLAEGGASDSRGAHPPPPRRRQSGVIASVVSFRAPLKRSLLPNETAPKDRTNKVLGDGERRVRVNDPLGTPSFAVSRDPVPAENRKGPAGRGEYRR